MFCHRCGREAEALAFCSNCGVKIRRNTQCLPLRRFFTQKDAIGHYFNGGFKYQTIINFLKQHHDINISLWTLKRRLVEYGLTKKGNVSVQRVCSVIEHEIKGPSALLGYRSISYGIIVPRDIVAITLKDINPAILLNKDYDELLEFNHNIIWNEIVENHQFFIKFMLAMSGQDLDIHSVESPIKIKINFIYSILMNTRWHGLSLFQRVNTVLHDICLHQL